MTSSGSHVTDAKQQEDLKKAMGQELKGSTWELGSEKLARVLSQKIRRKPLEAGEIDKIQEYDVTLDKLDNVLTQAGAKFRESPLMPLSHSLKEVDHYSYLIDTLNKALDACRSVMPSTKNGRFYALLRFFDRGNNPMADGVYGANPLKPDVVGISGEECPSKLWWRPATMKRADTAEVPYEVKESWAELINQAATYARCLFSASPLRSFALVLAYNQAQHSFRFLVFHRGGLTASTPISFLTIREQGPDQTNFLRLLISLLTWESRGDAGLPEWSNDREMILACSADDREGKRFRREASLFETLCLQGRAAHVWKLSHPPYHPVFPVSDRDIQAPRSLTLDQHIPRMILSVANLNSDSNQSPVAHDNDSFPSLEDLKLSNGAFLRYSSLVRRLINYRYVIPLTVFDIRWEIYGQFEILLLN